MIDMITVDKMPRDAKIFFDEGTSGTPRDAIERLAKLCLAIRIAPSIAETYGGQVALLTIINSAARTFLGGVFIEYLPDTALLIPSTRTSLRAEAEALGASIKAVNAATISIGTAAVAGGVAITATGMYGGVVPAGESAFFDPNAFVSAIVFASALAVSEVFERLRGAPLACERSRGLNLWDPTRHDSAGPDVAALRLPERLWLAGLGHLGQGVLWQLSLLPFSDRTRVHLTLQDFDYVIDANRSTGLLIGDDVGIQKTRLCATWLEVRGFRTSIIEQRFGSHTRRTEDDPAILISGFDRPEPRVALLAPGFDLVVDAGLGSKPSDFTGLTIYTLPGPRTPVQVWSVTSDNPARVDALLKTPNYTAQRAAMGECGAAEFAGKAVGASFVGAATAAIGITQVIRRVNGSPTHAVIDSDLRSLESTRTVLGTAPSLVVFPTQTPRKEQ